MVINPSCTDVEIIKTVLRNRSKQASLENELQEAADRLAIAVRRELGRDISVVCLHEICGTDAWIDATERKVMEFETQWPMTAHF